MERSKAIYQYHIMGVKLYGHKENECFLPQRLSSILYLK